MTIEIKKENYYSTLWRADLAGPNDEGDLLACLFKDNAGDGKWNLLYRFRYYKDDAVFNSKDEKKWYHFTAKDDAPERETEMEMLMAAILEKGGETGQLKNLVAIKVKGDGDAMSAVMLNPERPWSHAMKLTPEQYAEYEKTGKLP